jgi:hypothetical protein
LGKFWFTRRALGFLGMNVLTRAQVAMGENVCNPPLISHFHVQLFDSKPITIDNATIQT